MKNLKLLLLTTFSCLYFSFAAPCYSQEQITITTYYPSPFGIYNSLVSRRISVGDVNSDGQLNDGDAPSADNILLVSGQIGIGIGVAVPSQSLDVNGNINVRSTQVRMANSPNHFYGDNINLAVRMGGDFYVQDITGTALKNIHTAGLLIDKAAAVTTDPLNGQMGFQLLSRYRNKCDPGSPNEITPCPVT